MKEAVRKLFVCVLLMSMASFSGEIDAKENMQLDNDLESNKVSEALTPIQFTYTVYQVRQESQRQQVEEVAEKTQEDLLQDYIEEDLYWLSRIVSAEAKGESEEGQIAVANVVLNRVNHDDFPDTIKDVIFQKNQFSPVKAKTIYDEPTPEAVEAAKKALSGEKVVDEGVLFFYNPKIAPKNSWLRTRKEAITIGNHRFTY